MSDQPSRLQTGRWVKPVLVAWSIGLAILVTGLPWASEADIQLPADLLTHPDGRAPLRELYSSYLGLTEKGWYLDIITISKPAGTTFELPIIALRSPSAGEAIWILSGIHGEEPAGPNAIARAIDDIAALGADFPVALIPLCNPHGYARNWRYLNTPVYSETVEGQSVGDSSHLLPDLEDPAKPRAALASSAEAEALTRYLVRLAESYPPRYSIDLHEDDLIPEGYVYSQGKHGVIDPMAIAAVRVLRESRIPIKSRGQTRFGEDIEDGLIGPVTDSSIDELISSPRILVDGRPQPGPAARTVLVFETPAKDVKLDQRVAAHLALLQMLATLTATPPCAPSPLDSLQP